MTDTLQAAVPTLQFAFDADSPLRSELLGDDKLAELARQMAAYPAKLIRSSHPLHNRLYENEIALHRARKVAADAAASNEQLMPDAEWLLDNFFIIEDVFREVKTDLPYHYYDELPVVEQGPAAGLCRIYGIAIALVSHTDSHLDEAHILRFIRSFQETAALTIGELWAIPTVLRLALLENLRRLGDQMVLTRAEHERAIAWVQKALAAQTPPPLPDSPSDTFLVGWHQAVRDLGDGSLGDAAAGESAARSSEPLTAGDWLARHAAGDLSGVLSREYRRQASNQVSIGNCITSLRLLGAVDWNAFFERASLVEAALQGEPTGQYRRQDFTTRNRYRSAVEALAKAARKSEVEVARLALARAASGGTDRERHVGYYLIAEGRNAFARELGCRFKFRELCRTAIAARPNVFFFGLIALLAIAFCVSAVCLAASATESARLLGIVVLAVLLPAIDIAVALVNYLVCRILPPTVLPKFDFSSGIPSEFNAVVVIPGMLAKPENAIALCERLELHHLASPDPHLRFALLTDWSDAQSESMPNDEAVLKAAEDGIAQLNERYRQSGRDIFFLFHRKRSFDPSEGVWMGWERKRGKLDEFNRLLRGDENTTYIVRTGNAAEFEAKFVLTLDADTVLPRDAARRLVATLAHPLNRPVLSKDGRCVEAGYGVIQPRISFLYMTGLRSRFARIFAGSAGIDPYSSATSDVYQDLFGCGTFTGKGLYDIDAFRATAGRAFPGNSILSHDLIESNFARCALATDIEVFDEFPTKYHAFARREHRWIRGDWQLLPWLGRNVPTPEGWLRNPQSLVARWKILDNLRRSVVPTSLLILAILGWLVLPGSGWWWSLAALSVVGLPFFLQLFDRAIGLAATGASTPALREARKNLQATAGQWVLSIAFLPNQATLALDAIFRTLYRLLVSHRHLLEWETSAATEARLGTGLSQFVRSMWTSLALVAIVACLVAALAPSNVFWAAPWLLAWLLSPLIAWWVSLPLADPEPALSDAERSELRATARKTWRFFDAFVTDADNWLPPDNYQEDPKGAIAHRTSPTNKGLLLLSTLSAHDLGYICLSTLIDRTRRTLDTFDKLERCRGHFLNWYDTETLKPLAPSYVSTVDSGNLLGCLLAFKNGLAEQGDAVIPSPAALGGLLDSLNLAANSIPIGIRDSLRAHLGNRPNSLLEWEEWLERVQKLSRQCPVPEGESGYWFECFMECAAAISQELSAVNPWLAVLRKEFGDQLPFGESVRADGGKNGVASADASQHPHSAERLALLHELNAPAGLRRWAKRLPEIRAELVRLSGAVNLVEAIDRSQAAGILADLDALCTRAEVFADEMDFRFLYSEERQLFSIGYNVGIDRLDGGFYDLLASEAALTSYLAVARGVVPRKHWFQLGRLVTETGGSTGLLSWGGTMFEYLMPRLLLLPPRGTMLDVAQRAAVSRQREYGRQTNRPWGVSESGFAVLSPQLDYQYQSFGVPGLGLKRGLGKDRVIAPYATLLATMLDAKAAVENFQPLRTDGGEGPYGFYEAIDFTPDRLERGERCRVVKSYMAHHQGMGLCAIVNRLMGDIHCARLHAEPAVRAVELLLQERVPLGVPELLTPKEEAAIQTVGEPDVSRRLATYDTPEPRSHILSNGHYTVMVTNSGAGFSTCNGMAVTTWRTDTARDNLGSFIYVRDPATGRAWSAGYQPLGKPGENYEVIFSADKAEFTRRDGAIETRTTIAVAPDQDAEIRRITFSNRDDRACVLEVTSYAELVLNDVRADLAHPAFGKLFLETEWLSEQHALLCRKRLRSANQKPTFAIHMVSGDETVGRTTEFETDRAKFLGRRRSPAEPESLAKRLTNTAGAVLDPIFSLRKVVHLAPGGSGTLAFVTAVCPSREAALALANHYLSPAGADRAFDLAWARSRVELQHLGVTAAASHVYQRLAGHILYPPHSLRAGICLRENRLGQSGLWRFGISGDLPIITICISEGDGIPLARQALKAHAFWRGRGFAVDLVLLADRPASYREELFQDLATLARASDSRDTIDKPGGVFIRKVQPSSEERTLLLAASRVVLYGDRGSLSDQTDALARRRRLPVDLVPTRAAEPNLPDRPIDDKLQFFNGTGGFTAERCEYSVSGTPPAPWTNAIANPSAGCLTTDAGLGCTWVGNSQANRLTPWSNDPVVDPPSEAVYIRDEETGHYWTPTPRPAGGSCGVRHGRGFTTYSTDRDGLTAELTAFVPLADPVKILLLLVSNSEDRPRRLSATYFAEWVLGSTREQCAPFAVTEIDAESGTMLARCAFNEDYNSAVAFADTSLRPRTVTGDRVEFLGRNGSPAKPAALKRVALSNHAGAGLDPCAAAMGSFTIPPRGTVEVVFAIGQTADAASALRLAARYRQPEVVKSALQAVKDSWDRRIATLTVRTPDPRFDTLVNHWLVYQVLSCRFWGRTAFYQSGGAYGFRDQLQDVMALLYAEPALAREHILRSASRQFQEGDVQHWWHPPTGRGVRTRFSDDFLWLPYAVAQYVAITGDAAILDAEVGFLRGPLLRPEEQESYFLPEASDSTELLYEHCMRALAHGWKLGAHGLPLMGCGDWNDGMNLVGAAGTGESVWVGWFQVAVRNSFASLAESRNDRDAADRLRAEARQLRDAVETHAWDGDWYLRAWFDDGQPLGSHANSECRIDSLTQSWAVLAGGDSIRAERGVDSAVAQLVDRKAGLIKLFEPPFDAGAMQPGYIKGYVPGIRENGGQYTHAAVWLVQALAELGRSRDALDLWLMICPISHTSSAEGVARYKVEPYAVAADVYAMPPHVGRGGWTWYTGSAAWLYRAAIETILGFKKRGDRLFFEPRIPAEWTEFEVDYRHGKSLYRCHISNERSSDGASVKVWLDGTQLPEMPIPLHDDGREHVVRIEIRFA